MTQFHDFACALAAEADQPETTCQGLFRLADNLIGARLFTLTRVDAGARQVRRIHTNMPDAYPLSGTKPIGDDPWTRQVLGRHEVFVANDIEAIAEVFFDHALIASLGCESAINIPVTVAGQVLGTINCLHAAGHYTPERVARAESLKLPGAATFLLTRSETSRGDL